MTQEEYEYVVWNVEQEELARIEADEKIVRDIIDQEEDLMFVFSRENPRE